MITPARLRKRVEFWQAKLAVLGIWQFRIDRVDIVDQPVNNPDAAAGIFISDAYDTVEFEFLRSELAEGDAELLDERIIHEWLHAAMRDLDAAIESGNEDWISHEREGLVERLARLIRTC